MIESKCAEVTRLAGVGILILGVFCCLPGCNDDRQATADDVIYFFESARVGAKTWRLPEPAQGYVDGILSSYSEWQQAYAPMEELNGAGALWDIDSPRWQDSEAINETLLVYSKFRETDTSAKRGGLTDALEKAINKVPEIPGRQGLAELVVQTLFEGATIPQRQQVEDFPVAKSIELLLNDVQKHMDKLNVSTSGLHFTDPELQARILGQHAAIKAQIAEMQAAELGEWKGFLAQQSENVKELAPKVKELGATMKDRARTEYRRQKLRLEYHEEAVKQAEKRIEELEKATKQESQRKAD